MLARQGKPEKAIPLYQEALKVRPGDLATKRNLAVAYFKAQHRRSGWTLLRPLAVAYPADFQILDRSGLCLFALNPYSEAAHYLERANQADPSDLETLDILGKAYLRWQDYQALTGVFGRIMKLNPHSATAHSRLYLVWPRPKLRGIIPMQRSRRCACRWLDPSMLYST